MDCWLKFFYFVKSIVPNALNVSTQNLPSTQLLCVSYVNCVVDSLAFVRRTGVILRKIIGVLSRAFFDQRLWGVSLRRHILPKA